MLADKSSTGSAAPACQVQCMACTLACMHCLCAPCRPVILDDRTLICHVCTHARPVVLGGNALLALAHRTICSAAADTVTERPFIAGISGRAQTLAERKCQTRTWQQSCSWRCKGVQASELDAKRSRTLQRLRHACQLARCASTAFAIHGTLIACNAVHYTHVTCWAVYLQSALLGWRAVHMYCKHVLAGMPRGDKPFAPHSNKSFGMFESVANAVMTTTCQLCKAA